MNANRPLLAFLLCAVAFAAHAQVTCNTTSPGILGTTTTCNTWPAAPSVADQLNALTESLERQRAARAQAELTYQQAELIREQREALQEQRAADQQARRQEAEQEERDREAADQAARERQQAHEQAARAKEQAEALVASGVSPERYAAAQERCRAQVGSAPVCDRLSRQDVELSEAVAARKK